MKINSENLLGLVHYSRCLTKTDDSVDLKVFTKSDKFMDVKQWIQKYLKIPYRAVLAAFM